ncbi:GNAT family N-acetyltransferase [Hymenobacter sp. ASUV-10]|uniref:GNAT family N-acetyltransferase n=1 Tax=Hymenobacter aranciens TaxID=3063996 RepID=A0ABT9BH14_9BACT|nr:GNAT family N-acetyltransferase [Hymenobacter sp. ASUV-10]MDO7877560.1 GNAT family N-acetyltransferase [Hymenobacter sp. ASUV-10]
MPPVARFAEVDFSLHEVSRLTPALAATLGQGFRCKRGEFGTFWRRGRIVREEQALISRCWIIESEGYLAGYITLLTDKLELEQPPLASEGVQYRTMPAVKIGLLAADGRARGAGRRLVEWALEYAAVELVPKVGVRFMTVDAFYDLDPDSAGVYYDASGFYARLGFNFVNPDEPLPPQQSYRTMYFDLKPLVEALQETAAS